MKFPKVIKHRRFEATIYRKSEKYAYYRLTYYAVGKRFMRHFPTYGEAKAEGERIVRQLADGSQAAVLNAAHDKH